ncbi:MAG TPA: glycosyltransferase [Candidatus Binataceae bacterium]|nr:glycosyltransferase [Candidatus Binataceae bacterium]
MARLVARGKYLFDAERKFFARGVSYGPFAPNSSGERYPEPDRVRADFALMNELGANLVRCYVPPPGWMIEAAARAGLRLMVGIPWPFHMAFLDSPRMTREIRESIRAGVLAMRQYGDAIAAYSLGNEVRSDIVRWHGPAAVSRFLAELYDLGKQTDPEGLFTYSNYPSAEYLDLGFLDFISFNVYLHDETDYRRYLTHLLASTGERPVVLSETGIDAIRQGEAHQAATLSWQARAAFELGLSGFIVFAFTDEWHTGGAEITDWAFGLTTRERKPKQAFAAVGDVFRGTLPPPLAAAARVSVVVAAYNAAATLGAALTSLREQNYPDYETIVVDDGSSDTTAAVAAQAGVRVVRGEHRGLGAARNSGIGAATGEIIAFLDADARADRDWLYHLAACITHRGAAAAGGPNFAPDPADAHAAAMAWAPGLPREVRAGDDRLAQLCGCNMAITRCALRAIGGFDAIFTAAGDDVDLSWRLADRGETLAAAPGAIVIHDRRATLSTYLAQQRGYGRGEGMLYCCYPARPGAAMYAPRSWLSSILGGARIYHGAFGRALFQSIYRDGSLGPLAEIALSIQWVGSAAILIALGWFNFLFGVIGAIGIACAVSVAALAAARAPLPPRFHGPPARLRLWLLEFLGPLVRSAARERLRWSLEGEPGLDVPPASGDLAGTMVFAPARCGTARPVVPAVVLSAMRRALIRRGVAVAVTDQFQAYDLQAIVPPMIRAPLNALRREHGRVALRWRITARPGAALGVIAVAFVVSLVAGGSLDAALAISTLAALGIGGFTLARARRTAGLIIAAGKDGAAALGLALGGSGAEAREGAA